ncbi:MAG: NADH-quinone oxidoreductase subunit NuoH [Anaerolineales bacterium]|jgi:NADH-quinone oxidoreductase subunit H|nr:NADH-quinone oxidoreductase subunit NuoH [Anaerolineales bacterium]
MESALIIQWIVKGVILTLALVTGFAYTTFYERKLLAKIQIRIGPNRVGPGGWLQPAADGVKLIFKEELIPAKSDKFLFVLAPVITMIPSIVIMAVVPWGKTVLMFGQEVFLGISDINVGSLYIMSVASIAVYGITLAGWASNNKYAMMGGLRSAAQMVSYELALGLAFVGPIMIAGSMSLGDIVEAQKNIWFIVYQPLGAFIFLIAALAEVNRSPFDIPEAEQELTAGYHTEYSGMKFALFFMAEYIKMTAVSAIGASLFFGGFRGPFVDVLPGLGPLYLFLKILAGLGLMIWIRATLPRIRYDRLMTFGWKILLPLSLVNVFITAIVVVAMGS